MPQNIYDDPEFFEGYSQFRRSREGLAGAPEWPTLRSMLPLSLEGLHVLDLGCGFGAFARWARETGAARVFGVDLSENMLDRARSLTSDSGIAYRRGSIENLSEILHDSAFDLIYSSLALHYIEDFGAVCTSLRGLLAPGGRLVFSVEHPIFTAPTHPGWRTDADDSSSTRVWPLDSYSIAGKRVTDWITSGIVKHHRPLSRCVNDLLENGFRLRRFEEWSPTDEQIAEQPELAEERHRPMFLLISAQAE